MTVIDDDQDEQVSKLTFRIDEMEKRILSQEKEMSALGKKEGAIKTPDFTSWGIIKGHSYTGDVFALHFAPAHLSLPPFSKPINHTFWRPPPKVIS